MKQSSQKTTKKFKYKFIMLFYMVMIPFLILGQVEICDNGLDDDNDNLIDLNDEDCICEVIEPPVSLIPNPSFEEMNCCPNDRSQLNCATDWIQASVPTTDFIHTCGWMGWDDFPPPFPFPDGEGIMGFRDGRVRFSDNTLQANWKEYAGACLLSPLLADSTYRFQFDVGFVDSYKSPPIDITFFGTSNCDHLPFGFDEADFGCPSNSAYWQELAEVTVSGGVGNTWVNAFIEITPQQDIYAIAIGPGCEPVNSAISTFYFFDNLVLADVGSFDLQITESSHPCDSDFTLAVPNNPDFDYQWYLSGVALEGEIFSELTQNYGEGSYQVRILDDNSCKVSVAYEYVIPIYDRTFFKSICEGESYEFGDLVLTTSGEYLDTFSSQNNCDSIVLLYLTVFGTEYETMEVSIFEGEKLELEEYSFTASGEYNLILPSSLGCNKLILLKLTVFNIFIPNGFSPNHDGFNDVFRPFAAAGKIASVEMQIFDRWGNLVYEGTEWDGSDMNSGVFVYSMNVEFVHGTSKAFSGSVTLVK